MGGKCACCAIDIIVNLDIVCQNFFCHNPSLFLVLLSYIVFLGTQIASSLMDSLWMNSAMDYHVTYISFFGCLFYLIL